jgi:PIN domain nuclease of toxin-antitoxin system
MKALMDTQVFLWWIVDDPRLSSPARKVITDGNNELYFSAASAWEIAIKAQIGRLKLSEKPEILIPEQLARNAFESLPINIRHALHVFNLPEHHRDPFDRIIISQAIIEGLNIITSDREFSKYPVEVIW